MVINSVTPCYWPRIGSSLYPMVISWLKAKLIERELAGSVTKVLVVTKDVAKLSWPLKDLQ